MAKQSDIGANDINRRRELEFRANELGISVKSTDNLDEIATRISKIIDEVR